MSFDHKSLDAKWQQRWYASDIFQAKDNDPREKEYLLVEFPFPSGAGLHVGHPRSYTALDAIARKRRMEGRNVLFPMGWDAFGLPAENYAIKTGVHPSITTKENINTFRRQLQAIGFSFDWSREFSTTDPEYYKWTQWMFLKMFEAGLTYKAKVAINWCPKDKIGLANEEVVGGACERCGTPVEQREKEQWMIAITKYADRLIDDLKDVNYLPKIKKQQEDWIGRSEGAEIDFQISHPEHSGGSHRVTVFTTRPDTIFGVTYIVLAPEHPLVPALTHSTYRSNVDQYVLSASKKTEEERGNADKEKTGVFTGTYAVNPATGEKVPVWISDYVLSTYGTGAVMGVPAYDERDQAFAEKFDLPVVSAPFVSFEEALQKTGGRKVTKYKLRDWVFSRQRYWGEPIPLVHCEKDGWVAVPESNLPVLLPQVEKYEPTDNGESPLANIHEWVNTTCPTCNGPAKRETDTMPNWAGSSWYFLRYIDPKNDKAFADPEKLKHWMPIDLYNGGMEHTTLHLLYSRFWNKFLFDQGLVPVSEPYARRHSHGLIMSEDGTKMSKSKGNVVNPDDIVGKYGADTFRTYILFMGPFEEPVPWSENGVVGVRRFLEKIGRLAEKPVSQQSAALSKSLEKTIAKVTADIDGFRFNTAVSALMILVNQAQDEGGFTAESWKRFTQILAPFAPHMANELWETFGGTGFVEASAWPKPDAALLADDTVTLAVQVNGKHRGNVTVAIDASDSDIAVAAKADENVAKYLVSAPKKVIVVKGKIISFVL